MAIRSRVLALLPLLCTTACAQITHGIEIHETAGLVRYAIRRGLISGLHRVGDSRSP